MFAFLRNRQTIPGRGESSTGVPKNAPSRSPLFSFLNDGVCIRDCEGSYQINEHQIGWAGSGTLRIENRGGGIKGFLFEEERKNHITADPLNIAQVGSWTISNASGLVTASAYISVAPDGDLSGSLIHFDNDSNDRLNNLNISTLTPGETYTLSFWLKTSGSVAGQQVRIGILNDVGGTNYSSDINIPLDWERIDYTFTASAGSALWQARLVNNSSATPVDFYTWGAQLESGSFPTSLIRIPGFTRLTDTLRVTGSVIPEWFYTKPWKFTIWSLCSYIENSAARHCFTFSSSQNRVYFNTVDNFVCYMNNLTMVDRQVAVTYLRNEKIDISIRPNEGRLVMAEQYGPIRSNTEKAWQWSGSNEIQIGTSPSFVQSLNGIMTEPYKDADYVDLVDLMTEGTFTRLSGASYQTGPSTIAYADANERRYENRGNGVEGVLIEPERQNLLIDNPVDISISGTWSENDASGFLTVDRQATLAPDGTLTANRINFGASANDRLTDVGVTALGGQKVCFSVWIKSDTSTDGLKLAIQDDVFGTKLSSKFTASTDWSRIYFTATYDPAATAFQARIYNGDATLSNSVYVWGAQVETGSFPTSLITGAQGIRPTDDLILDLSGAIVFGKAQFDFRLLIDDADIDEQKRILDSNTGAGQDNRLQISTNPSFLVIVSGTTQGNHTNCSWTPENKLSWVVDWFNRKSTLYGLDSGPLTASINGVDNWTGNQYRFGSVWNATTRYCAIGLYQNPRKPQ